MLLILSMAALNSSVLPNKSFETDQKINKENLKLLQPVD